MNPTWGFTGKEDDDPCYGCDLSCSGCAYTGENIDDRIAMKEAGIEPHCIGKNSKKIEFFKNKRKEF